MRVISLIVLVLLALTLVGSGVTEQLCPMVKVTVEHDFMLKLEDVETVFRCQKAFSLDLPGLGEIQFKPDVIAEYHQIDLEEEKHEREWELAIKPEFPRCPGWKLSILQGERRFPLKKESDRNRWWFSMEQDCILFLPSYFKHEEREFPHNPEVDRIEDELSFKFESVIAGKTTLGREFLIESWRFPNDPEDNRLRLVSQAELEFPFCSDSLRKTILLEHQHFPNDPERDRWKIRSILAPTCVFNEITLKNKVELQIRRYPRDPEQDWRICRFLTEMEKKFGGMSLNLRAYWRYYRRPNNPSSSTNRDEFWLRFVGERSWEQLEMKMLTEWRWRSVPVRPENDRLIRILELQLIWEFSTALDFLLDLRLESREYPNNPENNERKTRIVAGFKLNL